MENKIVHWSEGGLSQGCGKIIVEWSDRDGVKYLNVKTLSTTHVPSYNRTIPLSRIISIEN